jgi:hypothetical protein
LKQKYLHGGRVPTAPPFTTAVGISPDNEYRSGHCRRFKWWLGPIRLQKIIIFI